jgi:hypothetical protein
MTIVSVLIITLAGILTIYASALNITEPPSTSPPVAQSETQSESEPAIARVTITSCSVGGAGFVPGSVATLTLRLKNQDPVNQVLGVLVTGQLSSTFPADFTPTNQAYVASIGADSTVDVDFILSVREVEIASSGTVPFTFKIEYSDKNHDSLTNTVSVQVPVAGQNSDEVAANPTWPTPQRGWLMRLLASRLVRMASLAGMAFCAVFALAILALKWIRRK